jgi:ribosome biogenesis GTPase A
MKTPFDQIPLTGWYPGHMQKARVQMRKGLELVDLVVELVDARAPFSTRSPKWEASLNHRPMMILANKADLASPAANRDWQEWFRKQGTAVRFVSASNLGQVRKLPEYWRQVVEEERRRRGATRPLVRPVRIMVSGIPNVGKSTLVNHLAERNRAEVGPRPGVTRQTQWIPLRNGVEMLDTPGIILWPDIQTKTHELLLGLLNSIMNEDVLSPQLLSAYLVWCWRRLEYPVDWSRFGCNCAPRQPKEFLEGFARVRGFLRQGGVFDLERAAVTLLREFRAGAFGRITLEKPPEPEA